MDIKIHLAMTNCNQKSQEKVFHLRINYNFTSSGLTYTFRFIQ